MPMKDATRSADTTTANKGDIEDKLSKKDIGFVGDALATQSPTHNCKLCHQCVPTKMGNTANLTHQFYCLTHCHSIVDTVCKCLQLQPPAKPFPEMNKGLHREKPQ